MNNIATQSTEMKENYIITNGRDNKALNTKLLSTLEDARAEAKRLGRNGNTYDGVLIVQIGGVPHCDTVYIHVYNKILALKNAV